MRVEEARALAEEGKRKNEEKRARLEEKSREKARNYAEKHFQPTLKEVLRRIKETALSPYLENKIDLMIEVKTFWPSGELCDGALERKLLVEKLIDALISLGYEVELHTRKTIADSCSEYAPDILVSSWVVKW